MAVCGFDVDGCLLGFGFCWLFAVIMLISGLVLLFCLWCCFVVLRCGWLLSYLLWWWFALCFGGFRFGVGWLFALFGLLCFCFTVLLVWRLA